jgi:hypothetical protein
MDYTTAMKNLHTQLHSIEVFNIEDEEEEDDE